MHDSSMSSHHRPDVVAKSITTIFVIISVVTIVILVTIATTLTIIVLSSPS